MSDLALHHVRIGFPPTMRFFVGACGGLAAVCVKFLGQDLAFVQQLAESGDPVSQAKLFSLAIAYGILTPMLMFLGGLIGWASEEKSRLKLLAMGVAAPALVTTWAGGSVSDETGTMVASRGAVLGQLLPVTPAQAQEGKLQLAGGPSVGEGVRLFFGVGKGEPRYAVVVGEHGSMADAQRQLKRLEAESPGVAAYVEPAPSASTYRVLVGDYPSYDTAERVRGEVDRLPSVHDATVSAVAQ